MRRSPASSMAELSYTLTGVAGDPAVLFLHGFMGSSEDWQDTIATLDGRCRCLAVDLPGHGDSVGLLREAYTTACARNGSTLIEVGTDREENAELHRKLLTEISEATR